MKTPPALQPLIDDGIIDEVIRSLKSGKEATVYIVRSGTEHRCAKVYRDMAQRSFQQRSQYQEGRKVRGSRQARAIGKKTRFGRKEEESAWKNAEVNALYQLTTAGVRVPRPYGYFNGVLIMELITDAAGASAPRLGEVELTAQQAREYHAFLITQVVRMLCAGVVHGDLSEFNVLLAASGPVIIDLPQAVDAAGNACPSLHVAAATFTVVRVAELLQRAAAPAWLHLINAAWFVAIVYSTLAIKQHVALDAVAGALLGVAFALPSLRWRPATRRQAQRADLPIAATIV